MGRLKFVLAFAALALGMVAAPLTASGPPKVPAVDSFEYTDNLTPLGLLAAGRTRRPASSTPTSPSGATSPSRGRTTGGGRSTSPSRRGRRRSYFQPCNGKNQGDIVVWGEQGQAWTCSWSSNTPAPAGMTCDGQPIPVGFEGVHVFDLSNFGDPQLVAQVDRWRAARTPRRCVPDPANGRVIIYNQTRRTARRRSSRSSRCRSRTWPRRPSSARHRSRRQAPATTAASSSATSTKMVCASHSHANVFDIGENEIPGGSITSPHVPVPPDGARRR